MCSFRSGEYEERDVRFAGQRTSHARGMFNVMKNAAVIRNEVGDQLLRSGSTFPPK